MLGCVDGTVVAMVTSSVVVSVGTYCKQCVELRRLILIWDDCFLFGAYLNAL